MYLNKDVNIETIKIVLCGVQQLGVDIIHYLIKHNIKISHIVSVHPEKASTENISGYVDYSEVAVMYDIPLYFVESYSMKSSKDIEFFQRNKFDILVQGVWQRLFPEEILKNLNIGAIGVHGSSELLPIGRGRSPINWSIIEGKKRFIFHYFLIKPGVDDGDIFYREIVDINEWDDCATLYRKNSIVTKRVLVQFIPKLVEKTLSLIPQKGEPTYYPKRSPKDGIIDWNKTVFEIYNFVRGLTHPYPGAYTFCKSQIIRIWKAQPFDTNILYPDACIREVVEVFQDNSFLVNCLSGTLLVTDYSGKVMVGDILGEESE